MGMYEFLMTGLAWVLGASLIFFIAAFFLLATWIQAHDTRGGINEQ